MSEMMKYQPQDYKGLVELALTVSKSSICAVSKPEDALVILMTGAELGLTAMQSLRGIYVVKNRPVLAADTMAAVVRKSGMCEYLTLVENTNTRCTYKTKRKDDSTEETMSWTEADAKAAGLWGSDTWKKYPRAMLRARTLASICRAVYPDVLLGMYDPEEMEAVPGAIILTEDERAEAIDVDFEEGQILDEAPALAAEDIDAPAPEDWAEDRKWQTQKGRFFALMGEAEVLDKEGVEAFRSWIKQACGVTSFKFISPGKLQKMNDKIQEQKPFNRGEWVRSKLAEAAPNHIETQLDKPVSHTAA